MPQPAGLVLVLLPPLPPPPLLLLLLVLPSVAASAVDAATAISAAAISCRLSHGCWCTLAASPATAAGSSGTGSQWMQLSV
jgi:hypothetical protein